MIIEGEKGGKGGKGGGRAAVEQPNNLFAKQTIKLLEVISEGEIAGVTDVYFDDNNITNFTGADYAVRTGASTQTHIAGFDSVTAEQSVGVEVTDASPVARDVTSTGVDSVIITYGVDSLFNQNKSNGDINGHSVSIAIDVRESVSDPYVQVQTDTISGKTMTPYFKSIRVEAPTIPPPAAWGFKIRRTSANANLSSIGDVTNVASFTEVTEVKLSYDDTALVGIFADAESTGGRIPRRGYDVDGIKMQVPDNYNPVTKIYTGVWGGTFDVIKQFSSNPIWCLYDLLTNTRYGAGIDETSIDKYSFYDAAVYCDELVDDGDSGTEPRFTFNGQIASRDKLFNVGQLIASTARATVAQYGGMLRIFQDSPESVTDLITNNDVVGGGEFNYAGSALAVRFNSINVAYNNPGDNFLQDIVTAEDETNIETYGFNEREVTLLGVTSQGQALRQARWLLHTELNQTDTVTFRVGLNRMNIEPFSVIEVQDEDYAEAILSAKVIASNGSQITLDKAVVLDAETYTVDYYGADGETINSVVISESDMSTSVISGTYADPAFVGSSLILKHATLKPRQFRVISITDTGEGQYEISGMFYDATKYDAIETGYTLPADVYTKRNLATQLPVQSLSATEEQYHDAGSTRRRIRVDWTDPTDGNAIEYGLTYTRNSNNIETVTGIKPTQYVIDNAPVGEYHIEVFALNINGAKSTNETVDITLDSVSTSSLNAPINFQVQNGVTTTQFDTTDVGLIWENPAANEDIIGVTLKDFVLEVYDSTGTTLKNTYIIARDVFVFVYTNAMNREDFGAATRNVQFKLYCRDAGLQKSTANTLNVTNPSPAAPSATITDGYEMIIIDIVSAGESDIAGYQIYADGTTGFTPSSGNLVYDGASPNVTFPLAAGVDIFFKCAAYDQFGKTLGELNLSSEYTTTGLSVADDVPLVEYKFDGFNFSPSGDTLSWDAGTGYRTDHPNQSTWAISSGSGVWTTGTMFVYSEPEATTLSTTTNIVTALATGGVIIATYKGGNLLSLGNGDAFIDGGKVIAQTIGAGQLVAGSAVITGEAQLGTAVVNEAAIKDAVITAAKIVDATITGAKIATATIETANIADANITGAKIADATIEALHLAEGAITNKTTGLIDLSATRAMAAWSTPMVDNNSHLGNNIFHIHFAKSSNCECDGSLTIDTDAIAFFDPIGFITPTALSIDLVRVDSGGYTVIDTQDLLSGYADNTPIAFSLSGTVSPTASELGDDYTLRVNIQFTQYIGLGNPVNYSYVMTINDADFLAQSILS